MARISAVVNTYNEEKKIDRCLASLKGFANEIVVVDMMSTDKTRELAKNYNAKIFKHKKIILNNVNNRITALEGKSNSPGAEYRLYCSDQCKQECPIYAKQKYSAEENNTNKYSREVQPELRQMVFERDNWTCQKCDSTESLHCHHVEGIRWEPIESADIDKCITFCKTCHKEAHKKEGCGYNDLRCDS